MKEALGPPGGKRVPSEEDLSFFIGGELITVEPEWPEPTLEEKSAEADINTADMIPGDDREGTDSTV